MKLENYMNAKFADQLTAISTALKDVRHGIANDRVIVSMLLEHTKLDLVALGITNNMTLPSLRTFVHIDSPFTSELFGCIKQVFPDAKFEKDQVIARSLHLNLVTFKFIRSLARDSEGNPVYMNGVNYTETPFCQVEEGQLRLEQVQLLNLLDILLYTPIEQAGRTRTFVKMLIVAHFLSKGYALSDFMKPVYNKYTPDLLMENSIELNRIITFVKEFMK